MASKLGVEKDKMHVKEHHFFQKVLSLTISACGGGGNGILARFWLFYCFSDVSVAATCFHCNGEISVVWASFNQVLWTVAVWQLDTNHLTAKTFEASGSRVQRSPLNSQLTTLISCIRSLAVFFRLSRGSA